MPPEPRTPAGKDLAVLYHEFPFRIADFEERIVTIEDQAREAALAEARAKLVEAAAKASWTLTPGLDAAHVVLVAE